MEIFAVDSASGFSPSRKNRRARGIISDGELNILEGSLSKAAQRLGVVRAIVCHHSLLYGAPVRKAVAYRDILGSNQLNDTSRERLLQLALRHQVTAILTGHVHRTLPLFPHRRTVVTGSPNRLTTEVVSQTTLQTPASGFNGSWLHRIGWDVSIHWTAERWEWTGSDFQEAGSPITISP